MCNVLLTGLLCMSLRHTIWSACHCRADKWHLLFFPQCTRFTSEGRRSYTYLMRKLIRSGAKYQMSFHVRDFCRALSQLVHCRCCGCWTAFWTLLESSFSRISLMTMYLFSFLSAFDHHFVTDENQPFAVSLILSNYFSNLKAVFGLICGFYNFLFPVLVVGCTVFTTGSSESSNMESNLALPHLYSSTIGLSGSFQFCFWTVHCHVCETRRYP